jgi:hypothetical protein
MEIARVQAIKSMQERERASFLFHYLFSYSAVSLYCLTLAKHSISLSFPFATRGREIPTEEERAREKKHS